MSHSRPLSIVRPSSTHSDVGRGRPRLTSPSAFPVHLDITSPVADSPKETDGNQLGPSLELSSIQLEIGKDDPHDSGVDDFGKHWAFLGEPNAFPIDPAILSEEDWVGIGLLHSTSDEHHLSTIGDLDTNGTLSGLSPDRPSIDSCSQDCSETGQIEPDARELAESVPDQSSHQMPTRHDREASMATSNESKNQERGQKLATSKRLSSGAEGLGERSLKRPRLDDCPVSAGIDVAHDPRDSSALVDAISPVPIDQLTIPTGEDQEITTNGIHQAISQHDNAGMSDQVDSHACSNALSKPLILPGTRRSCGNRPVKTHSPVTVDVAHQHRRSTRRVANLNSPDRSSASTTFSRRSAKPAKKRGRAARVFQHTSTPSRSDGHTFTALRSQFLSSPFEVRIQFVSFLFEAALGCCIHDFEADSHITAATAPEVVDASDEEEWEVEEIVASRIFRDKLQYQVQWKGCEFDVAWYAAHGFKGAPYKVQTFHETFPDQPGPPKRLKEWIQSWQSGQELPDVPDDDLPS